MDRYRKSSHACCLLHYDFVFIPKYRKPVLRGDVATRLRELVREVSQSLEVEILRGHLRPDHVHLLLDVPPKWAPSQVMQAINGKTSHPLLQDFRRLRKEFWGRHLWARGYFVATSGNVTDGLIAQYIESQGGEPQDEEGFQISE
ncbi:MAG TPA: IS200/IS605 family transposase [Thermoanaerobaculia bacterium]|nr:IS200/IS605 family transposase [Thermoanaerobaculia bacterium]